MKVNRETDCICFRTWHDYSIPIFFTSDQTRLILSSKNMGFYSFEKGIIVGKNEDITLYLGVSGDTLPLSCNRLAL